MDRDVMAGIPADRGGFPVPVLALSMCAFCIGTAEYIVMGLLPDIAHDLGVSIPSAGQLITGYALGVVLGAPILAVITARMERKRVLLAMVAVFIIGNFLSAIAPTYSFLMASRVLAAFAHGTLFGVGSVLAADMVASDKRASAIALMFTGLTLATILGVPLGTFVGQNLGWRASFWAITALGLLALVPLSLLVPRVPAKATQGFRNEIQVLKQPDVLVALLVTILASASNFTFFTYIVPILRDISGFSPHAVTLILLLAGLGFTVGMTAGGKLADRGIVQALCIILCALILLLIVMAFVLHSQVTILVMIFFWAATAFASGPALQTGVIDRAAMAPNLASTLNIGAFNLGNAGGAILGALVIGHGMGLGGVPLAAAGAAVLALAVVGLLALMPASEQAGSRET